MKGSKYLNSVEAANILGVNVSTIKRWTDSGKLNCIKTAGGHRKFLMKHLNEYLKSQPDKSKKVTVIPYATSEHRQLNHLIQKHNIKELHLHLFNNAIKSHRDTVYLIITGLALAQYPLYKIFDELVTPVLHQIGELWEKGKLTISEEHIASDIIRDSILQIREIAILPTEDKQKVFCFALDDDQHDIALKMIQILLEQRGFDVFYSGQSTPADSIEKLISFHKPTRVYLSCTYFDENWTNEQIEAKNSELSLIYNFSRKYNFELFIGGSAFNQLNVDYDIVKQRLLSFEEIFKS
ncbi:helix-turn-helix domain-containing protein [Candidatus Neomarinimicrobiota bacterium]